MDNFLAGWAEAAKISLGFFWMALWAFALGYVISSLIQLLVTREKMQKVMQGGDPKSVSLGAFFGFISSSCSFAALATTRALFAKGAGFIPAMAFLLASTNLVIELGFVIAIFLGWQFVVAEYIGGVLLILFVWLFVWLTRPQQLIKKVRDKLSSDSSDENNNPPSFKSLITSKSGWQKLGMKYVMEWQMIWKDVLIGFTVAGLIASFVPNAFFESLFVGTGSGEPLSFWQILLQTLVGPLAAFFTFIGSMGNIPLAALLFDKGVSFAGVMAFIFSDLVVYPVLRINARYYGWKMAFYIVGLLLAALVVTSLTLHYGFSFAGMLPDTSSSGAISERDMFAFDYGFVLNLVFLTLSGVLIYFWRAAKQGNHHHHHDHGSSKSKRSLGEWVNLILVGGCILWLVIGGALLVLR
ncbi:permease [Salinimonas chungwhensis]|uniref:permease n=1 Tax=Salinimonas chungwhensis TaxID=265425 RepID=UPI0004778EA6|nr:permease [Salinimonas chungwhensis]